MTNAIRVHQVGGPDAMQWEPVELGDPGPGQVRLRHQAVGLNYIDVYHRTGLYPQRLPFIPGVEGAGMVEAVGDGVTSVSVGDRVAYAGPIGSYAEARLIDAAHLVRLPAEIDFDTAAAMMLQGLTVDMLINRVRPLKAGETILVHAAAGGVGLIACQWAKALGLRLIATAGSDAKCQMALDHGAVHAINYRTHDFVAEVKAITAGAGVKVVYDSVGKDTFDGSLNVLRPFGLLASFGNASGPVPAFSPGVLGAKGSLYLTRATLFSHIASRDATQAMADDLFAVVLSGAVKIRIDQRYPLAEVGRAHTELEARNTTGCSVLLV